jgi:hypothetical protein
MFSIYRGYLASFGKFRDLGAMRISARLERWPFGCNIHDASGACPQRSFSGLLFRNCCILLIYLASFCHFSIGEVESSPAKAIVGSMTGPAPKLEYLDAMTPPITSC